jgi:L-alanine-DL-glutamate epimerase-like enolase superfamily enzyme
MKTNNYDSGRRAFLKTSAAVATLAALPVSSSASTDAAPTISPASGVKIKEVRTFKLKDALFVQVVADNGVTGWGESSPNNRHVVETFIHTG